MIKDNSQNIEGRAKGKYQLGTFGLYKLFVFLDPGCQNLRFFEVHASLREFDVEYFEFILESRSQRVELNQSLILNIIRYKTLQWKEQCSPRVVSMLVFIRYMVK